MQIIKTITKTHIKTPLFSSRVPAGFPSSADDYIDARIDLNKHLIKHPSATFFVRVKGSSMNGCGITGGDLLVVDRSLNAINNSIIVAFLDGEFTLKRVRKSRKHLYLIPENSNYKPIKITDQSNFEVWGVVTHVIKQVK